MLLRLYLQADDRRLAELHYKASLTLQYLDQPDEALKEIKVRLRTLNVCGEIAEHAVEADMQHIAP